MELKKILNNIEGLKAKGNLEIDIKQIENDSRKVEEGALFVAITGFETDGHEYIETAIKNGAIAILAENIELIKKIKLPEDVTLIMAPNTRKALAVASANFYGNPSQSLKLIGITGTKGKTTTSFMLKAILEKMGHKVGLLGTVANYIGDKNLGESSRTTPESIEIQRLFAQMVKEKVDTVIMEVSSQSLKLDRVAGCDFDYAIFTNFSEDHISPKEHPSMEDYFNSKLKLFSMCTKKGFINSDDFKVSKVKKLVDNIEIKTYGIDNSADLIAKDITVTNSSVDFKVKIGMKNERIKVNIPGRFSVYNCLAALSVALQFGTDAEKIVEALAEVSVPGRSEMVPNKKGLSIMIDYAHSPESLESILKAVKSYTRGRVISLFGCGGDRDSLKRPIMGEISGRIADFTIISSDNPRTEKPEEITKQIEEGIKRTQGKYIVIVDRKEAIKYALNMATKTDQIVLAGKGHETYQEIDGKKTSFDERQIVKEICG
ncbi:MAG: UDP-N-acetylmuramoyl-L-alanyl-D-glutamate--2,6-diaminopimelate ligase [Lachnospiraceae bacterium]|jgi:UDP-N-acetylmuramoyl-L-alanyl-D-glutamate--2,6-diaminopimelate ligase|nr:UDP-N-acetylmuramoyl-L-alanyl-D-glutamate--2,6-diaminopimelate ligase [Lachnospiraceae bacterium]